MAKKVFPPFKLSLAYFIFISLLLISTTDVKAQCAGNDVSVTFCGLDIVKPSSRSIDLFLLLGGGAIPGGTWNNDNSITGFDVATGILNAQLVNQSAVYTFTYTAPAVLGCTDNMSTVSVTIGGYAGIPGPNGSVCGDASSFNLFQLFNGSADVGPQSNGTWYNNTTNSSSPSVINPSAMALGTYQYTYTMPAIGICPEVSSVAFLTIYKPARSGIPFNLIICETEINLYNNIDLNDYLIGEDPNGVWSEFGTNEITFLTDHNINLQNIYNNSGIGSYEFAYTVNPTNSVCEKKTSIVKFSIDKFYDFTGTALVVNSDTCEENIKNAIYIAYLTQGIQVIPNGSLFNVYYQVTGANGGSNSVLASFSNGVLTFPISNSYFQTVGTSIVTITNIVDVNSLGVCKNIIPIIEDTLTINPKPDIDNATLSIDKVCKGIDGLVQITDATNLADGSYTLTYNLSGVNTVTAQTVIISVVGGISTFVIPKSLIPNTGDSQIVITQIINNVTGCKNKANLIGKIVVIELPDISKLAVTIANYCKDEDGEVKITGLGVLTNVIVQYNVTGVNPFPSQSITLSVTGGSTSFTIPSTSLINTGASTFNITSITNAITGCVSNATVSDSFVINPIPLAPTTVNQSFCETQNATVANLLPSGAQYQWYSSPTVTTALANTTALVSGNYAVREVDPTTGCKSPFTTISVIINKINAPILNANGDQFCGLDKPTLQDLTNNTNVSATIQWYDAQSGGNLLPNSTLLLDGATYYGYNTSTTNTCLSVNGLKVTVILTNCPDPVTYDFFIPDGFSPNDDGVNDTFKIPKIDFIYPNYSIDIFNRYGNIMFSGNKNRPEWSGKTDSGSTGGIAPNGVYFYVINFNKDNKSPLQGRIYLNR
jgi:gliding motility-associated-like protein